MFPRKSKNNVFLTGSMKMIRTGNFLPEMSQNGVFGMII
jgi:hypothetical protein